MDAASNLMRKGASKAKPKIEIVLDDDQEDVCCPTYTTLDEIRGHVTITCAADMPFDDVYITFEGQEQTEVEKVVSTTPTNSKSYGFRLLFRLVQPMGATAFPDSRVLEAHKPYQFPFRFVVPAQRLPQSCVHRVPTRLPEGAHLALPPSLGDPMVSAFGRLGDDLCPSMVEILYSLRCRITSGMGPTGRPRIVKEALKKVGICPAVEEAPPLQVDGGDTDDYILRREKSVRLGTLRKKVGRLVAMAAQPRSLSLPPLRSGETCAITTMAFINARFDPADQKSEPPRISALSAKLKVATFFAAEPGILEPVKRAGDFSLSATKGLFVHSFDLPSRTPNIEWQQQSPEASPVDGQPLSMDASARVPGPSKAYKGGSFYTARIGIPIELPSKKLFVPSFNSCFVSRLYVLDIIISAEQCKATLKDPSLLLKLPLQISCRPNPNVARSAAQVAVDAIASTTGEDFFTPRNVAPPDEAFLGQSNITPPSYSNGVDHNASSSSAPASDAPGKTSDAQASGCANRHISFAPDVPVAPGLGYTHRSSWAEGIPPDRPTEVVPMMTSQQRSLSLAFDSEGFEAIGRSQSSENELPPEYSNLAGRPPPRGHNTLPSRRASEQG